MNSQYDQTEILTYELEEGDYTINEYSLAVPIGSKVLTGQFASQVNEGNFLSRGTGENTLKRVATGGKASHFNPYEPEGAVNEDNTVQANAPRRIVGAIKIKPGEFFLPVAPNNAAIAVNDELQIATAGNGVIKSGAAAGTSTLFALEIVALNASSAKDRVWIRCLSEGSTVPVA